MSGRLDRHEQAPRTDEEWEIALQDYALDLDEGHTGESEDERDQGKEEDILRRKEASIVDHSFPPDQTALERVQRAPLIHHADSSDSLDNICPGERRRSTSMQRTKSGTATTPSGTHLSLKAASERSGSFGSVTSDAEIKDLLDRDNKRHVLGIGATVNKPPVRVFDEDEEMINSQMERQEMRAFYEREGWLRAPRPSKATLEARKRTIRRLGLSSPSDCAERKAVMTKYSDLAKTIFQTSSACVSILHEQQESTYFTDEPEPRIVTTQKSLCGHALHFMDEKVTAIADISLDWRFAKNDIRETTKFYASVPLRYHRHKGRHVDVGTLCIYDTKPRDTFDDRERDILARMANMLVYQLATLHSEMMAKRARGMYEQTIAFLRRSLIAPLPKKGESSRNKPRPSLNKDQQKKEPSTSCTQAPHTSVKSGPKDSKSNKERDELADRQLFDDAAKTVQGILASDSVAIVGLEDFQLFIRKTGTDYAGGSKDRKVDKEKVVLGFTQGKPWPAGVEPIVVHVPTGPGLRVLGKSGSGSYHFDQPSTGKQFSEVIRTYIKTRHFWWDREEDDEVSQNLMSMMPTESKTTLMATLMTSDGTLRIAVLASWNKAPNQFGDYSRMALPFAWILGGSIMAAMSVRKVRSLEQSQISYSNLQAHELRTPLHQILAITQLLRSQMTDLADTPVSHPSSSLTTMQQIRDLLPMLDAIDTSGKTLHGIVDNILSFLDLSGKDNMLTPSTPGLLTSPSGAAESIEVMFEELIDEACEEDKRTRAARGQPQSNVETIFEIIPPLLGESVTEDAGGALRKALSKILSNAYKFIESQGCVEIYVDDVAYRRPPEGCEDISLTRMISIMIVDSGKGMEDTFVKEKLGEPWAKEDPFATGSGLSVHLAWRIIDLMGGSMEISSTPGGGCTVKIEVPVPRRKVSVPNSPEMSSPDSLHADDPSHMAVDPNHFQVQRQVALLGYDFKYKDTCVWGLPRLGQVLQHSFVKLGCHVTTIEEAEVVVLDGRMEEASPSMGVKGLHHWLDKIAAEDIVILVTADHEAHPEVLKLERELGKRIRRYRKPITPTILREILFPNHAHHVITEISTPQGTIQQPINSPDKIDAHGNEIPTNGTSSKGGLNIHFDDSAIQVKRPCKLTSAITGMSSLWKPKGMPVEEAVASLCLGDYFSSRRKPSLARTTSNSSSSHSHSRGKSESYSSTPTLVSTEFSDQTSTPALSAITPIDDQMDIPDDDSPEAEPENIKVMVVEDNMINRKILVKILSSKLNIEVLEAEDGSVAVELFREFTSPVIVLLDINMPKMDGYQASTEMRAIEKQTGRSRSHIIAVTALASDDEKHRGLVECGMDKWLTKPCDKPTITRQVDQARRALMGELEN